MPALLLWRAEPTSCAWIGRLATCRPAVDETIHTTQAVLRLCTKTKRQRSRSAAGGAGGEVQFGSARYGTTSARREIAQRLTVMVREARLKPRCSFSLPGAGSGSPPAATDPRAGAVEADAPKNCEAKASIRLCDPGRPRVVCARADQPCVAPSTLPPQVGRPIGCSCLVRGGPAGPTGLGLWGGAAAEAAIGGFQLERRTKTLRTALARSFRSCTRALPLLGCEKKSAGVKDGDGRSAAPARRRLMRAETSAA